MKMLTLKQILAGCSVLCCLLIATESRAVDVGDVFYSDGSFSATITEDANKLPIGLVYWVGTGKDNGLIMSLKQPGDMNYTDATPLLRQLRGFGYRSGDLAAAGFAGTNCYG